MRLIFCILLSFAVAGIAAGATPTPTPEPSPTPAPTAAPAFLVKQDVNLWREFGAAVSDGKLYDVKTRREYTTPSRQTLHITDIQWSCFSEVEARLEWDLAVDVPISVMKYPQPGQGASAPGQTTPKCIGAAGVSPVLTTDRASNGVIFVDGYVE